MPWEARAARCVGLAFAVCRAGSGRGSVVQSFQSGAAAAALQILSAASFSGIVNGDRFMLRPVPMELSLNQTTHLRRLRRISLAEGVSTLVLFGIAMPMKYFAGMPMAVTIVGTAHGALFVLLAGMFLAGVKTIPLPPKLAMLGILAAVLPFGPFLFDSRLKRLAGES
jgi:integral membrane protein